jgi:DNA polymerase
MALEQQRGRRFLPLSEKARGLLKTLGREKNLFAGLPQIVQAVRSCRKCRLSLNRTQAVPGLGPERAALFWVGEGPGFEEDQQGRPFVGPAGQLLTRMLKAIELHREEVYITNVVKCRPPENRTPQEDEIQACSLYLKEEIRLIRPALLVALGKCAARTLIQSNEPISQLRLKTHTFQGIPLIATYHPAFLLRNPEAKKEAWEDLKKVRRYCHEPAEKK